MYDSDAVVLKNPQPLFEANAGVELVGSAGKGPESIGRVWGRTICTGVLLMRSSPDLGEGIGILSAVLYVYSYIYNYTIIIIIMLYIYMYVCASECVLYTIGYW